MPHLGYVCNSGLVRRSGHFFTGGSEWLYLQKIAPLFSRIDINANIIDARSLGNDQRIKFSEELQLSNAVFHDLNGYHQPSGVRTNLFRRRALRKSRLLNQARAWDVGFFVGPNWALLDAYEISKSLGLPYAVMLRGEWLKVSEFGRVGRIPGRFLWYRFFRRYIQNLENRLMRDAAIRLTNVHYLSDRFQDSDNPVIEVLNVHIPPNRFFRRQDTCSNKPYRILSVGALTYRKGFDVAIRAIADLKSRGESVELQIVGDGPDGDNLASLAKAEGIESDVCFLGHQTGQQLFETYRNADVFLLCSRSEGFPRVVHEAFSQSLPVVCTTVGGIPQKLQDEKHALLIQPDSVGETIRALERVLEDGNLRTRILSNGYSFANELFSNHPVHQAEWAFRKILDSPAVKHARHLPHSSRS